MQSLHPPCEDGTRMELYEPCEHQETSDSTTQKMSIGYLEEKQSRSNNNNNNKKRRKSSTQESLRITKKKISKDKSKTYKQPTQPTNSSKTSGQALVTTTAEASRGFWNAYTKELSKKLWLPIKTVYADTESSCSNGYLQRLGQNSWFTAETIKKTIPLENLQTISLPFATSLWQETTGEEHPTTENDDGEKKQRQKLPAGKVKQIRLFPTKQQKKILNNWFGTVRWTYNQVLAAMIANGVTFNKQDLRSRFVNNDVFKGTDKEWVLQTPYDVRDAAMMDVLQAYKTNFAKRKKNPSHHFKIKFRSKYAKSQAITIHSKHWKRAGIFHPKSWGKEPLRAAEPLPDNLIYDTKMIRNRLGEFYLCQILPLEEVTHQPEEKIIALDPGVRTFMTGYSPEGTIMEWGKGDMQRIFRLCYTHDKLQSKWNQKGIKHQKRYRLKQAARRICKKIRNLVDEIHKKLTKWLVDNYETILLPKFETSEMVTRAQRRIGSRTARQMLTWGHYRFQQRLVNKTREYRSCQVIICDEAYTSKTCGACGNLHDHLGGQKTFRCPHCGHGVTMDRDMNGARNILLRYFTLRAAPWSGAGS